jgi:hypothetical protein
MLKHTYFALGLLVLESLEIFLLFGALFAPFSDILPELIIEVGFLLFLPL